MPHLLHAWRALVASTASTLQAPANRKPQPQAASKALTCPPSGGKRASLSSSQPDLRSACADTLPVRQAVRAPAVPAQPSATSVAPAAAARKQAADFSHTPSRPQNGAPAAAPHKGMAAAPPHRDFVASGGPIVACHGPVAYAHPPTSRSVPGLVPCGLPLHPPPGPADGGWVAPSCAPNAQYWCAPASPEMCASAYAWHLRPCMPWLGVRTHQSCNTDDSFVPVNISRKEKSHDL